MRKLKDIATEPVSLTERIKGNARRMRLAGIGLYSKVEQERVRIYRHINELGESYGGDAGSLVGRLTLLGTGTVNLVLEESQRLFDELVEAGELALAKESAKSLSATGRVSTPRPVAKPAAPRLVASAPQKPATARKPVAKPAVAPAAVAGKKAPARKAAPAAAKTEPARAEAGEDLQQSFAVAKARLTTLTAPPDQKTILSLYALFKQANEGDVSGRRPGLTQMVDRAKFDARQEVKGIATEEAMKRYIATVNGLFPA